MVALSVTIGISHGRSTLQTLTSLVLVRVSLPPATSLAIPSLAFRLEVNILTLKLYLLPPIALTTFSRLVTKYAMPSIIALACLPVMLPSLMTP